MECLVLSDPAPDLQDLKEDFLIMWWLFYSNVRIRVKAYVAN